MPRSSTSDSNAAVLDNKTAALCHWVLAFFLALAYGLEIVSHFFQVTFAAPLDAAFILIATASVLAGLWRQLPLQNVLPAALGIAVIGGLFSALGARTGMPFGPFLFRSPAGATLFGILPWAMPLVWVVMVLVSRGVGRLMLRPWRKNKNYGFRLIGLTAILVLLFDLAFDPYAFRVRHYWLWTRTALPVTWQGAPLFNFVAWGLITALILLFITPVLIIKKTRTKRGPDLHPLCLWVGAVALFGTGYAVNGFWAAFVVDMVIGFGTAVLAIRGAMW